MLHLIPFEHGPPFVKFQITAKDFDATNWNKIWSNIYYFYDFGEMIFLLLYFWRWIHDLVSFFFVFIFIIKNLQMKHKNPQNILESFSWSYDNFMSWSFNDSSAK